MILPASSVRPIGRDFCSDIDSTFRRTPPPKDHRSGSMGTEAGTHASVNLALNLRGATTDASFLPVAPAQEIAIELGGLRVRHIRAAVLLGQEAAEFLCPDRRRRRPPRRSAH